MSNHSDHLSTLIQNARDWIDFESSIEDLEEHHTELKQLIADAESTGDHHRLSERFEGRLHFGTAGLRGEIGSGPQRMNLALIRWVSVGLSRYLGGLIGSHSRRIVIGYDGRHRSLDFAREAADCLCDAGFDVELSTGICPTPLLAYAVCHRNAIAGIMVTASHNPPKDNGFKVYWGNGAQIIPPQDLEISTAIDQVDWRTLSQRRVVDLAHIGRLSPLDLSPRGELGKSYREELSGYLASRRQTTLPLPLKVVYTAMHGVGAQWTEVLLGEHPELDLIPVLEQRDPDPDFPTVSFPNPEEPGALDLAKSYAERHNAPLILAHDPDADRLAVVARTAEGELKAFTGDQIGALIAHEMFSLRELSSHDLVATTIVSSSLLREMAKRVGVQYAETLTGFKWIANRALSHKADGGRFLFGYEEAIGYSLFGLVNDKDGLSAGLFLAEMALRAQQEGLTLWDRLSEIYRLDGLYLSSLISRVRRGSEGAREIAESMQYLRTTPPTEIAGTQVIEVTDFLESPQPLTGDVLRFRLADGSRVIARPSGTEPKLKLYFEVRIEVSTADLSERRDYGEVRLQSLSKAFEGLLDSAQSS